ncbi:MAG: LysR family transcriptional regulator [Rhodospirillales bacterium]|nr:LysR family transcriptional regulator [Rhodospirillales bacterium]
MELRHLRYFVAVAEELHMTRAAERLGIAQPPLSQQIQALEREIGVTLFHRIKRHIELTDAGKLFLEEARRILIGVEAAVGRARRAQDGEIGRIRVGLTESASFNSIVTGALRAYRAAFPDIELTLEEKHTTELAESLRDGTIDAAFLRPPFSAGDGLDFRLLTSESMIVALPAGHGLATERPITLSELAAETFILYPRSARPGLSDMIAAACAQAGFTIKLGQQAPQLSAAINLVAAGMGISVVPQSMRQMQPRGVVYRALKGGPTVALGLAYRKDERARTVLNFIAQLP